MSETGAMSVVSSGVYSDYRVLCVCDSRERAEEVASLVRGDTDSYRSDVRVEDLPFIDDRPVKVDVFVESVTVWDDGTVTGERSAQFSEWPFDALHAPLHPVSWRWVRAPVHEGRGGRLDVQGTDAKRVRKVLSDRKAQLLAEVTFRRKSEAKGSA